MAAVALMLCMLDYAGQIVLARAEATITALGRPSRLDRDSVNSSADARNSDTDPRTQTFDGQVSDDFSAK
jgi:hypothetical protein